MLLHFSLHCILLQYEGVQSSYVFEKCAVFTGPAKVVSIRSRLAAEKAWENNTEYGNHTLKIVITKRKARVSFKKRIITAGKLR